jgi:hypothetical protein
MHFFIHLYFLTEFEILFYIFYIMPYEKELILDLITFDTDKYNISFNYNDYSNCPEYQHRLDTSNHKLWNICVYYLIAINAILFLLFCKDFLLNYVKFGETPVPSPKYNSGSSLMAFGSANNLSLSEQKKNDDRGVEMVSLSKRGTGGGSGGTEEPKETWFLIYYWKQSVFIAEMYKTVQFIILVAVFEYLFFKLIVNKYKILDKKTLLCNLAKKMKN